MDVRLDGESNFEVEGEPSDVFAVIVAAEGFLREKGRAMLSVVADGEAIPADQLVKEMEGKSLDAVDLLEIASEEISSLVDICLQELEAVLPELPAACHALGEVFHGEAPETGYEPFERLAEIWHQVKVRQMQIVGALGLDEGALEVEGVPLAKMHNELNGFLNEAAEALQVSDNVCLGDLLEYELAPRSETEEKIVALLRQCAQQQVS